jgi:hypothetical protein
LLLLLLFSLSTPLSARTLTAADGRTIEAEVIGFEGTEKVTIKRSDTGQTFTLPIASFAEADRKALLAEAEAEAAKPPGPLGERELGLEFTRRSGERTKSETPVYTEITDAYTGRLIERKKTGSIQIETTDTSFVITFVNRTKDPITDLRIEYAVYSEAEDTPRAKGLPTHLTARAGRGEIKLVPAYQRVSFQTEPLETRDVSLRGSAKDRSGPSRGTSYVAVPPEVDLAGYWIRVYQDKTLVREEASPSYLRTGYSFPAGSSPTTITPSSR